jgi:molybdopterin/thiamine biosynthesis adenylyltransferase
MVFLYYRRRLRMSGLNEDERERYDRQIRITGWGEIAQAQLKNSRVFVAGAGGLGSPVILYLAASGVGTLRICDDGELELSNLNRQVLHSERNLQKKKVESAAQSVGRLNAETRVETLYEKIDRDNVGSIVADAHIMVDCLDNFETRYILNEHAVRMEMPLVHAGVTAFSGQVTFIHPPQTPCLYCMVPEPPESGKFPILGATAGLIGSIQALEALKYLTGVGSLLKSRILFFDGKEMRFHVRGEKKMPSCAVCGRA